MCAVVPHYDFNLHYPIDLYETEHMCIDHFDIHFGEMPIQVFCPYLYRIICLSRVDCGSPLFGLDMSSLSST